MSYKKIAKQIEQGQVLPVYLCYGTENYLLQQFVTFVTEKLIDADNRDFAVSKFDLAETPIDAVIDDALTPPFLVPQKLVIAKDAKFFTSAKEHSKIEHRIETLIEYLKHPADFSVIIFTVDVDKLDERKKVVKLLKEAGGVIPFLPMTADELEQWVKRQGKKWRIEFEPLAVERLILNVGTNLGALAAEIEKCGLFVGGGQIVSAELVEQMVIRNAEQNVFVLVEEIAKMRIEKAYRILQDLFKQKEEPIKILMLLARQFRIITQSKHMHDQGYSDQQIASQLGLNPYAVKLAVQQGRQYEFKKLAVILERIAELDYLMKTGRMDKMLGLETFILHLAI